MQSFLFLQKRRWTSHGNGHIQRGRRCAVRLRIQLDDALLNRTPRTLVLDFGGVGFMDSSGIGLILGRQRCARTLGGTLRIQHAPEALRRVLQLANIPCVGGESGETI